MPHAGIDADHIVEAALLALELVDRPTTLGSTMAGEVDA